MKDQTFNEERKKIELRNRYKDRTNCKVVLRNLYKLKQDSIKTRVSSFNFLSDCGGNCCGRLSPSLFMSGSLGDVFSAVTTNCSTLYDRGATIKHGRSRQGRRRRRRRALSLPPSPSNLTTLTGLSGSPKPADQCESPASGPRSTT